MPKVNPVDSKRNKMRLLIAMKAIEAVKELRSSCDFGTADGYST